MNIMDLLKNAPGLLESIQQAGVPGDTVSEFADALGQQLGGGSGFDFTDLLGGLDLDGFLSKVDVGALAEQVGLSPEIVQQALQVIGPKVAEFSPKGLGGLAGKLFG